MGFATMVLTQVAHIGRQQSRIPYNEKLASVSPGFAIHTI